MSVSPIWSNIYYSKNYNREALICRNKNSAAAAAAIGIFLAWQTFPLQAYSHLKGQCRKNVGK